MKVGILGGGQLGRMLLQEAANYQVETWVMEKDNTCPAAHLCHHFVAGDIRNREDVYRFGNQLDLITIEIENVNIEALEQLEAEGKIIIPTPAALKTIGNKINQKKYYQQHHIPTSDFDITDKRTDLEPLSHKLPAVHKLATGGYDGKGVQILRSKEDIPKGFDAPALLEQMVDIHKEIAITVAIGRNGQHAIYPPVEMIFDGDLNLLDYQICPAEIPEKALWKAEAIALSVARNFKSPGLFAVEMFLDRKGDVYVNETAPRVHNSGHHTIEAHYSSQFDMLWRVILGYPLEGTDMILPSIMLNLLGADNHRGNAHYEGLEEVLGMEHTYAHIYGKKETVPGRKMGHVTILGKSRSDLLYKAKKVKHTLRVISKSSKS